MTFHVDEKFFEALGGGPEAQRAGWRSRRLVTTSQVMNNASAWIEAQAGVAIGLRQDGPHTRLAVMLQGAEASPGYARASIDVLRADGTSLLCRLNLFEFPHGGGDVDVILNPQEQVGTFFAWLGGRRCSANALMGRASSRSTSRPGNKGRGTGGLRPAR